MNAKRIRKISYRSTDSEGYPVPALILQGKFLQEFGFCRGELVSVDYRPGRIVITIADKSLTNKIGGGKYGFQQEFPELPNFLLHKTR